MEMMKTGPLSTAQMWDTPSEPTTEEPNLVKSVLGDWQIKDSEIEIDEHPSGRPYLLGSGAFGIVHRATLNGFQTVAVKSLLPSCSESAQADFLRRLPYCATVGRRILCASSASAAALAKSSW